MNDDDWRADQLPPPHYPVKGYSLTLPISDETAAPVSTVMDETYKIAITRLGNRIRVGGTAEISGYDLSPRPSRRSAGAFGHRPLWRRRADGSRKLLVRSEADDT